MVDGFFSFVARVPVAGYEWINESFLEEEVDKGEFGDEVQDEYGNPKEPDFLSLEPPGWVLVGRESDRPTFRTYDPLREHSGLFRVFAGLNPDDREAILQFANEFGLLGDRPLFTQEPRRCCEPLFRWCRLIDKMSRAVSLWDLLADGDEAGVNRLLGWDMQLPFVRPPAKLGGPFFYSSDSPYSQYEDYRKIRCFPMWRDDLRRSAEFLLDHWINNHLRRSTFAQLVTRDRDGVRVLQTVPKNLLTAMWLQFAQSIEGNRQYRTCKECNRWFEISSRQSDHRTVRRLFCSDPCKSREYRRRKERALELKGEGKSVKEIATELDTGVETIKKWTGKRKG